MTTSRNMIRKKNLDILKRYIYKEKSALKADMAAHTGLSVVTINSLVQELVSSSIITTGSSYQQSLGRPALSYDFNYDHSFFLLMSIQEKITNGNRNLIIVGQIVNLNQQIKYEKIFDFSKLTIDFFVSKILYFLNLDFSISKIGVSLPGKVYKDTVLSSWNDVFNSWTFGEEISKITNIPFSIQNDAHLLTVGYTLLNHSAEIETVVGIYYPERSMPGITIYSNGAIFAGGRNLAGEAKLLPNLINCTPPINNDQMIVKLIEILEIYNAVISPDAFILSTNSLSKSELYKGIDSSEILSKQLNNPEIFFVENFQHSLTTGLFWLVTKDTPFYL